jgi:quercetin dioxygenase-like cupin family protein
MEPKTAAAWHTHPSPVFVYVAEGELVMEVEGQETKTIQAGEAVAEPLDARMRVLNTTDRPASVVVFQISPAEEEFLEGEN